MSDDIPIIFSNEPILPGNADGVHSHDVSERRGWQCPVCNVGVHPDSKVCPNCVKQAKRTVIAEPSAGFRQLFEQLDQE